MRYYSDINNTEIVSQIGGSATLPCKASRSSDAAVTWIRRSDFALLTGNLLKSDNFISLSSVSMPIKFV